LVPYDNPQLLNGSSSADAKASPFVIAIRNAGISGLPSVMNAVIMVAVLSVGNSSVYGSSRVLAALANQGQAPKILGYVDRKGRPMVGIAVASLIGALAYFAASDLRTEAFTWMLALSGLSSIFTWGSICLSHIRFRKAWCVQGHTLDELAFRSQPGVIGSWVGLAMNCIVLVAQFWTGFAPVGYADMSAKKRVRNFFEAYLAAPIVIICYIGYKLWYRTPFIRSKDMDLHTGIRELNIGLILAEERAERAAWPVWRKVYKLFC
jgi:amino acid transporter